MDAPPNPLASTRESPTWRPSPSLSSPSSTADLDVVWLGHATVDVRLGPTRILTDPLLRDRVAHLRRHRGAALPAPGTIDAVVVSHVHHDHLDLPSLRRLSADTVIVVPRGAGRLVGRAVRGDVVEVDVGDSVGVAGTRITAVPADHGSRRVGSRVTAPPLGFVFERDGRVVYFPGDTDLHPVMSDLPASDVALLPIWGWGRSLGDGHLDPERAARAASILRTRAVLPVHWGTFAPIRMLPGAPSWIDRPASIFAEAMARHAPDTALHLVPPGPTAHRIGDAPAPIPRNR